MKAKNKVKGLLMVALMMLSNNHLVLAQETPEAPGLVFAFEVLVEVADPTVVGDLPNGTRRIVDILGGTFEGPGISGRVVPGGADWQIIREDGFTDIDARYTLKPMRGSDLCFQYWHSSRSAGCDYPAESR